MVNSNNSKAFFRLLPQLLSISLYLSLSLSLSLTHGRIIHTNQPFAEQALSDPIKMSAYHQLECKYTIYIYSYMHARARACVCVCVGKCQLMSHENLRNREVVSPVLTTSSSTGFLGSSPRYSSIFPSTISMSTLQKKELYQTVGQSLAERQLAGPCLWVHSFET